MQSDISFWASVFFYLYHNSKIWKKKFLAEVIPRLYCDM